MCFSRMMARLLLRAVRWESCTCFLRWSSAPPPHPPRAALCVAMRKLQSPFHYMNSHSSVMPCAYRFIRISDSLSSWYSSTGYAFSERPRPSSTAETMKYACHPGSNIKPQVSCIALRITESAGRCFGAQKENTSILGSRWKQCQA